MTAQNIANMIAEQARRAAVTAKVTAQARMGLRTAVVNSFFNGRDPGRQQSIETLVSRAREQNEREISGPIFQRQHFSQTHIIFDTVDSVHSTADKWRIQDIAQGIENHVKPGAGFFVAADEEFLLSSARARITITASAVFYAAIVIAARESTGTAFPAAAEYSQSTTKSLEEIIAEDHFPADNDWVYIVQLKRARRQPDGTYQLSLNANLANFVQRVTKEYNSLSPLDDLDYEVSVVTYSVTAQTLSTQNSFIYKGRTVEDYNRLF